MTKINNPNKTAAKNLTLLDNLTGNNITITLLTTSNYLTLILETKKRMPDYYVSQHTLGGLLRG